MSPCTDPLPDFTNFSYRIVTPPNQPKGRSWEKLKECERRLALYRWAERLNAPPEGTHYLSNPSYEEFLNDCLSAFLMALEAALQFTGDQLEKRKAIPKKYDKKTKKFVEIRFGEWLRNRPSHDRHMRGLRTLRHFAGHVKMKPVNWGYVLIAEVRDLTRIAGSQQEIKPTATRRTDGYRWTLPQLTRAELKELSIPELNFKAFRKFNNATKSKLPKPAKLPKNLEDLRVWNKLVFIHHADTILEHGLRQAQKILLQAEKLL
jgi:hypothetical protein